MAGVSKGRFPARPRRKIVKRKVKNFHRQVVGQKWKCNLTVLKQVRKNLHCFHAMFGDSDDDDEFHGFSSEECGLIAYKRVNSNRQNSFEIPDILCSPIDLNKKKVTTRLAHARNSLDSLPVASAGRTESRKSAMTSKDHSSTGRNSSATLHKTSPIKPAKFIAPSMTQHKHHVTNVTPTCLKIKIDPDSAVGDGPGHPKVLAKALLTRANKRLRKHKVAAMKSPVCTSTPIATQPNKSKARSFVLPTKSCRSSRIIKANRKYVDNDVSNKSQDKETDGLLQSSTEQASRPTKATFPQRSNSGSGSPAKGRPLLKEPTFRVAALANINNKPRPTRNLKDKGNITRMRAHKLIKRARFKHPTSSSTLVVGNDFKEEVSKRKSLIREATFKAPSKRDVPSNLKNDNLSDLGLSEATWDKILRNDSPQVPPWTKQEIHNVLHGANTFLNSWASIARHYDYLPAHRDWLSVRTKVLSLEQLGLLSANLKVKSSILLQLKHRYSGNPNVTVFTQKELSMRGMKSNVECIVGEGGRMRNIVTASNDKAESEKGLRKTGRTSLKSIHIKRFQKWQNSVSKSRTPQAAYLNLEAKTFHAMCAPSRCNSTKAPWSAREIHNVLHGIHIFGVGEWSFIRSLYLFHHSRSNIDIRGRYKAVCCKMLVIGGEVKKDILPLLQPKLSETGTMYFTAGCGSVVQQSSKRRVREIKGRTNIRKRRVSEADLTSPPRKQTFHLFGTAPVWDDTNSGLQSLKSNSEVEEDPTCENVLPPDKPKRREKVRRSSISKGRKASQGLPEGAKWKGPRIKHVCRRASLVTGQKVALYSDGSPDLHLSALPKEEREKIAAEMEKQRGTLSESTVSTDTEEDTARNVSPPKQVTRRKERIARVSKKKVADQQSKTAPSTCKNYKLQNCVDSKCSNQSRAPSSSLRRPAVGNATLPKEAVKKASSRQKRSAKESKRKSNSPSRNFTDRSSSSVAAGVLLSPDSRRRLQQDLHDRCRQLPSIVKIDEWKERYELEDLWNMGGVALITSTTPSTRFVCFLCGSVGKARPMRRISASSESSADLIDDYPHSPLFILCRACCEPFHPFCLDDHEQQPAIADAKKGTWICKRCRFCNVCGRPNDLLECKRCTKTYHSACLGPSYPTKPSKNRVWVCMRCVRCRSCGSSRPGRRPGSKWTHDFQLCQRCGDLFDKGNFCPICRRCYRDEDYESRMVQCGTCRRWVHSRCESLTIEMYTFLSHLPEDVQYVCPDCDGRRAKVELELGRSNMSATDECGNNSLEGDRMRSLLCKLPSPQWKEILEREVQAGIETVTMALFHNKEAACILKKPAVREDDRSPVDLFAIRYAVHNSRYSSVAEFSSDVCRILDATLDEDTDAGATGSRRMRANTGARGAFCQEMHGVFPWFDVDTGRVRDSSDVPEDLLPHATLPPHDDHNYAQWQDRDIDISAATPDTPQKSFCDGAHSNSNSIGTVIWSLSAPKEFDMRQCLFCGKYGDDHPTNAGRLIYCGQDEWIHVNCALWSAEVFERHDGSLQNVYSAVSRGRMMKCESCKLPGATVGCNTRDCPNNYHFACAKATRCSFQNDKKVFCARHARHVDGELVPEEGFEISRRVVVDNDEMRPNKRWQRGMQSQNVTILLGSATIHQLGHLSVASDSRDYLIPVHFRMTRLFWSTVHAGRRVRYTISITEQKSPLDGPALVEGLHQGKLGRPEQYENHTIAHVSDDENVIKQPSKKSSRYPSTESCKSRLIDRMSFAANAGVLARSKSHDEAAPEVPKFRRLSGSLFATIRGACSRTMLQTSTPSPAPSRSSSSFRHPVPDVVNEFADAKSQEDISITPGSHGTATTQVLVREEGAEHGDASAVSSEDTLSSSEVGESGIEFTSLLASATGLENQQLSTAQAGDVAELVFASSSDLCAPDALVSGTTHNVVPFNTGSSGALICKNNLPDKNMHAVEVHNPPLNLEVIPSQSPGLLTVLDSPACDKATQALRSMDDVLLCETPSVENVSRRNFGGSNTSKTREVEANILPDEEISDKDTVHAMKSEEKTLPIRSDGPEEIPGKNTDYSETTETSQSSKEHELRVTLERLGSPTFSRFSAEADCKAVDSGHVTGNSATNNPLPQAIKAPSVESSNAECDVPRNTPEPAAIVAKHGQESSGIFAELKAGNFSGEGFVSHEHKEGAEVRAIRTRNQTRRSSDSPTLVGNAEHCRTELKENNGIKNNSDDLVELQESMLSDGEEKAHVTGLTEQDSKKPAVEDGGQLDFVEAFEDAEREEGIVITNTEKDPSRDEDTRIRSRTNSFNGSSNSESSSSCTSSEIPVVSVRKFAKENGIDSEAISPKRTDEDDLARRRLSHNSALFGDETATKSSGLCNGSALNGDLNPMVENSSRAAIPRSRSVESSSRKKKLLRKPPLLKVEQLSEPRYPRRNLFTCLKSFAGLSPNYAIQSYPVKDDVKSKQADRANSRSLIKEGRKKVSRAKAAPPPKVKTRTSRAASEIQDVSAREHATNRSIVKTAAKSPRNSGAKQLQKRTERQIAADSDKAHGVEADLKSAGDKFQETATRIRTRSRSLRISESCVDINDRTPSELPPATENLRDHSVRSLRKSDSCVDINDLTPSELPPTTENLRDHSVVSGCEDSTAHGHLVSKSKSVFITEDVRVRSGEPNSTKHINEPSQTGLDAKDIGQDSNRTRERSISDQTTMVHIPTSEISSTISVSYNAKILVSGTEILETSNVDSVNASEDPDINVSEERVLAERTPESCDLVESVSPPRLLGSREKKVPETDDISGTEAAATRFCESEADLSAVSLPPIEVERGITADDKSAENPICIDADVVYKATEKPVQVQPIPANSAPQSPVTIYNLAPLKQLQPLSVDDMESPLSPRDEPRLPDQTDAAASFLVTSECPVLNVDEVQSLLAMPATTAPSTPTVTLSTPMSSPVVGWNRNCRTQPIVTPPAMQKNVVPYQYIHTPTTVFTYNTVGPLGPCVQNQMPVQQLAYAVPVTRTVLSRMPYSPSFAIHNASGPHPVHVEYHYMHPQYGMVFRTPLMPVVTPINQQPRYVVGPNQPLLFSNTHMHTASYLGNVQPAAPVVYPTQRVSLPRNSTPKSTRVKKGATGAVMAPLETNRTSAAELTSQSIDHPTVAELDDSLQFTPDQVKRLNEMIDFFSEKNNLSHEEKQLVRVVVAKKIKHRNILLPSPDALSQFQHEDPPRQQNEPAVCSGQKRKQTETTLEEVPAKKPRGCGRSEAMETDHFSASSACDFVAADEASTHSPLLDVYLNAIRAESTSDDELMKKWRDVVRTLSKHNVNLDIPWRMRKGQRDKENRVPPPSHASKRSHLLYEIRSEDGYYAKGADLHELVSDLLDAVQECRSNACVQTNPLCLTSILSPHAFLGVSHDAVRFLVEQLPGARHCMRYRAKYHKHKESPAEVVTHINPHGCARAEKYQGRSKPDMFGFLASKHRVPPTYEPSRTQNVDMQQNSTRRPTSMDLPMAMRFRHLKTSAREAVDVYRSAIHGRGLYCKRDIEAGEMVMEYTGEAIRSFLTDRREKMYEKKGIGCYMFRMDDVYVVDATLKGSAARFINHSCEPSCYSRMVAIDGKKHIIIFALRKILRGEELTYDYKFPIEAEDQKIMCNCGARTCRKFMN